MTDDTLKTSTVLNQETQILEQQLRPTKYELPASLIRRFLASVLDVTLSWFFITVLMTYFVTRIMIPVARSKSDTLRTLFHENAFRELFLLTGNYGIILLFLPLLGLVLYGALFESSFLCATPGKFLMGLRVFDKRNQQTSLWYATSRNILKNLHYVVILSGLIISLAVLQTSFGYSTPVGLGGSIVFGIAILTSLIFSLLNTFSPLFNQKRVAFHDVYSRTQVVQVSGSNPWPRGVLAVLVALIISTFQQAIVSKELGNSLLGIYVEAAARSGAAESSPRPENSRIQN